MGGTRDPEATRHRILDAATGEFAEWGFGGGRVQRIAEVARVSQRMIYAYYVNKDGLFDAVLEWHILASQQAVEFDPVDLPGYAQKVFDFYRDHPHFVRLQLWQYLERPELMRGLRVVTDAVAAKVDGIAREQQAGRIRDDVPADRLLDHILALVTGNPANPNTWSDAERDALGRDVARLVSPV